VNYPIWGLEAAGGGLLIALIAVIHVFVSHFAVGGGLFLVLTERKGYSESSKDILDYVKMHTRFFLLLTMVFGGLTGVGIWFIMALLNPSATSVLIHNFVFAWAIEWVFFLGEIIALLIYNNTFGRMNPKQHQIIGWLYFIFAWLSLFVINGIIGFMLTPGQWLETGNIWHGYLNPSFWPQLFFRSFLCFMLAGLYGFVTASFIKEKEVRKTMIKYCAKWLIIPLPALIAAGFWYVNALPEPLQNRLFNETPELLSYFKLFLVFTGLLFISGLIMALIAPNRVSKPLAFIFLAIGLISMGSFEFIREGGRRPYIIYDYLYSNSILKKDLKVIQAKGLLQAAKWTKIKKITPENKIAAGKELFKISCLPCHSIGGPLKDIRKFCKNYEESGLAVKIGGLGLMSSYMPPFAGNEEEKQALAAYITRELIGKIELSSLLKEQSADTVSELKIDVPDYDPETADYILLAWAGRGIKGKLSEVFEKQGKAILIESIFLGRGEIPEQLTGDGYEIFCYPAGLPESSEKMKFSEDLNSFFHKLIINEKRNPGSCLPYIIEAKQNGKTLAKTTVTTTTGSNLSCYHCHGGRDNNNYFSMETADNILAAHDRLSKTDLLKMSQQGKKVLCRKCHGEQGKQLSLSASLHGFHAGYLGNSGADACNYCHSGSGQNHFYKGLHLEMGLDCTSCHGALRDHALSLLAHEKINGRSTGKLAVRLSTGNFQNITPRKPFTQQPDCLNCHLDFQEPSQVETFNQWTESADNLFSSRTGDGGVRCLACHGSPHALYPQSMEPGEKAGNLAPRQYQKNNYPMGADKKCSLTCHTEDPGADFHHPNSYRMMSSIKN
jgi:cytochrome bd-type quinol oxidase subunit 1